MRARILFVLAASVFAAAMIESGCGGGNGNGGGDMATAADMAGFVNGCPSLTAMDLGGSTDTWTSYAQGFFASYCTRCHSSTLTGAARSGAPAGYNWDDQTSVNAHLSQIRNAVGVSNFMPPAPPTPGCDERLRLVRWIDSGAP